MACDKCSHIAVCGRYSATGGHVKECKHYATDNNVGRWIPVTERLPKEYGRCLCNVKYSAFRGCFYQKIMWYDQYGFRDGCIYDEGVTHWMDIPEPPKDA